MSMDPNRRIKRGWMPLKVIDVRLDTHDTKTFFLVDADTSKREFDYYAGQYLTIRFDDLAAKPIVRSYTMSSSPNQPDAIAVTLKTVENGLVSNWLFNNIKVGDILRARGPIGRFCFEPEKDCSHVAMVAGGSGVTPFISMMREYAPLLGQKDAPKKMTLLVSYKSREDLICWQDLEAINRIDNMEVICTLTREQAPGFWHGRIDHAMLAKAFQGQYADTTFMTCGPQAMMDLVVDHCLKHGVDAHHIKTESFES